MKKCSKCQIEKPYEEFNIRTDHKQVHYRSNCKNCTRKITGKWSLKNKEKRHLKEREYRNKPEVVEAIKIRSKKWYSINKVSVLNKQKQRRINDVQFKLTCALRSRLNAALKNEYKTGSAVRDLGCSIQYLRKHLELQFSNNIPNKHTNEQMSWSNYGAGKNRWNIDHIIPVSNLDLTIRENVLKLCHYTNLQPLWFYDNLKKSDKI